MTEIKEDGITHYWTSENPLWTIMILTLPKRKELLSWLLNCLDSQKSDQVEILINSDHKTKSIGHKRQELLDAASSASRFLSFIDDDDGITCDFIPEILHAIGHDPDVVTFDQQCTFYGGTPFKVIFSIDHPKNQDVDVSRLQRDKNWHHPDVQRKPFHMCVWRASIGKNHPIPDCSWGEDWKWCEGMLTEVKTQYRIPKTLHCYTYDPDISECG